MESQSAARQHQQQQQQEQSRTGEEEQEEQLAERRGAAQKQSQFAHRSQSSPSSLTTHKFGLRPTPSPPRLIIDHQTGDIVESYPEQPVYLRTYQPLESFGSGAGPDPPSDPLDQSELDQDQDQDTSCALDDSLGHPCPPPLNRVQQYFANSGEDRLLSGDQVHPPMSQHQRRTTPSGAQHYQRPIPPPHMHSQLRQQQQQVYFAPPEPSGGHLFNYEPLTSNAATNRRPLKAEAPAIDEDLSEAGRTDIAFVTRSSPVPGNTRVRVTAQPLGSAKAITIPASPGKQVTLGKLPDDDLVGNTSNNNKKKKKPPSIEQFKLYDFCYHFHLLAVALLSSLIIYLLAGTQLGADCARFRPTYTYVSLILASVNLVFILVFSLFWYCSGVTRTMYANLSSSAFIVSIYTILVALNLALAILLFFVNTCHFQKLSETRSSSSAPLLPADYQHLSDTHHQLASQSQSQSSSQSSSSSSSSASAAPQDPYPLHLDPSDQWYRRPPDENSLAGEEGGHLAAAGGSRRPPDVAPHEPQPGRFEMSPIEAGWVHVRELAHSLWRHLLQFLADYDLRFVGALHALGSICLQYLAMRVAVVRSHFCSPAAHLVA